MEVGTVKGMGNSVVSEAWEVLGLGLGGYRSVLE